MQTHDPKEFWNQIKSLGPRKKKIIPMEVHTEKNETSNDPEVVINKWKNEFSTLYNNFDKSGTTSATFKENVKQSNINKEQIMSDPLYVANEMLNCNIEIGEIKSVVSNSKCGKTPGVDLLPNEIFKNDNVIHVCINYFSSVSTLENTLSLEESNYLSYSKG